MWRVSRKYMKEMKKLIEIFKIIEETWVIYPTNLFKNINKEQK